MNLEEARKKYTIDVPSDDIFYSQRYKEYFSKNASKRDEELERYREFEEMYKKSFLVTFGGHIEKNIKNNNRTAVILGGQTGAGKTGLVNLTNREALLKNTSYYLIDDDQYRKFYPRYDEIMVECPEYATILTAIGSGPITPKIMKYASDNGMNFIFDGTMKNTRIYETAKQWENYNITYKVMATSRIESLLSIFERNAYLRRNGFGRPISVEAHDETYNGLEDTIRTIEANENENIEIYMRGKSESSMPDLIYSPKQKGIYQSAVEALKSGRNRDKRRCMSQDLFDRIINLEASEIGLNSKENEELIKFKIALREEMER